ncbi:MAG: hypothetical protein ABUT20_09465, partial [Bacteroidota bacterium]
MNKDLQAISNLIQQSAQLSDEEKKAIVKSLKDADKELEITTFKLDRTEKVKKTTAILLEETIAELEQKRKAVETQNRELEIETSLERVRTVAMGMRKADDLLDVCQALFAELHTLGFDELRNAMINIFSNDSISFLNYDYSENAGKTITTHYYNSHPVIEKQVNEIRSSHDAFSETVFSGKDLEEWRAFRKEKGEKDDPKMDTIPALFYYFYSIGTGAIGISTYSSIPDEKLNVLKRFRNVFDLAYRRFIDIEKAEAQARESQIQLSLERVRARTMAMQKSDELPDAANLLFQQIQSLGMPTWSAGYCIWDEDKKAITLSMSRPWGDIQPSFRVPLDEDPSFIHFLEAHNNGEELFVEEVTGKALEQNYEYLRTLPVVGDQLDSIIKEGHSLPTYQVNHCAYFSKGFLLFITYEQVSESHEIFKRFAKVFEQTYTRFLDLQKAEIQSREAQIELALERVRARTMAMQHSEELMEAANLLFQQVQSLGIEIWSCGFNIWDIGQKFCTGWMSVNGALQPPFRIPLTDSFTFIHMDQSRQKKESFYIEEVSGEALADHYRYMFSLPDFKVSADEHLKAGFKLPESQTNHVYNFNHGNLIFLSYKPIPEAANIFKRFTAVFEQTYTRFLDLQKAEAQAREAQIQLSLERVRARTMAMQKSDELPDAANLLFHQMQSLGMPAWSAGYCIWDANKQGITLWMSSEGVMQPSFHTPLTEDPSFIHFREAYERGESFHVEAVGGEELVSHYKYMRTLPGIGEVLDSIIDAGHPLPTFQIFHCAYFSQGFLLFITYEPVPEAHDIFKRFAKVFEQTYTRFLDLQKSEAQARESQIQLALERVRARTMAMQKSDELSETVFILFQQFKQLGENPDQATIGIINEDEWVIEYWVTMYGSQTNRVYKFPVSEPNVTNRIYNAWKEQRKSLVIELSGKELYDFAHFRESMGGAAYNPEEKKRVINVAFFSKGIINVQSNESRSEESIRLLERFAKVFEQTYTRFLDLQKAEAQARESQIQLALERVRAKSLAMHGSNELADVITILNEQLRHLGLLMEMRSAAILILEEGKKDYTQWIASPLYDKAFSLATPYLDNRIQNDIWEARQNKTGYYSKSYNVQEKNELFRFYFKQPAFSIFSEEEKNVILESPHYELSLAFEKNSSVGIAGLTGNLLSNEEGEIVKRAAKVFEQAYIRFLDLKKAEAQTREALIEAALEKVRSRTMAMHSSEDVSLATTTMFTELEKLGIENFRGGILNIKENKTMDVWSVNKSADSDPNDPLGRGKTIRAAGEWDMTLHPWWIELYKGWVNKDEFSYYLLTGKEKEDYVRILDARRDYIPGGIKELPDCHIQGYYFGEGA